MPAHTDQTTIKRLASKVDVENMERILPIKTARSHHIIVSVDQVSKKFSNGVQDIPVLHDISLNLYAGEFVIIYGPSGCGKSTLLHTILGLEPPTTGQVLFRDHNLYQMDLDARTNFRREHVGMVFQRSEWIKSLTVWENVAYPLLLDGKSLPEAKPRAFEVLDEVGLADWGHRLPSELSGGQQQRAAMARALVTNPWVIIADEPTGNLDTASSEDLMMALTLLNRTKSRMIILVTHDVGFLPLATRRIGMVDGRIVEDEVESDDDIDLQARQKLTADKYGAYTP